VTNRSASSSTPSLNRTTVTRATHASHSSRTDYSRAGTDAVTCQNARSKVQLHIGLLHAAQIAHPIGTIFSFSYATHSARGVTNRRPVVFTRSTPS
jgi:hypothetical protein